MPYSQFRFNRAHAEHLGKALSQPFLCFRHDEQACKAFCVESSLPIKLLPEDMGMEVDMQSLRASCGHKVTNVS